MWIKELNNIWGYDLFFTKKKLSPGPLRPTQNPNFGYILPCKKIPANLVYKKFYNLS